MLTHKNHNLNENIDCGHKLFPRDRDRLLSIEERNIRAEEYLLRKQFEESKAANLFFVEFIFGMTFAILLVFGGAWCIGIASVL